MKILERIVLWVIVFGLIVGVESCSSGPKITPTVTFVRNNSLLPSIEFSTPSSEEVYVQYWKTGSGSKKKSSVSIGQKHAIVLFDIVGSSEYSFEIHATDDSWTSKEFNFTSGQVPDEVFTIKKQKIDTAVFNGYVLIRRLSHFGVDAILNNEGNVVWYHLYDTAVRRAFTWTKRNTILSIYDSSRIIEINRTGKTILDLDLEKVNVPNKLHHEIRYDSKGNLVALTLDSAVVDLSRFGGSRSQNLRSDGIIVLDTMGKVIWEWNLLDVAKPLMHTLGVLNLKKSWGHANSFEIDADGHYLISLKEFNQVWKIDSNDGHIIWRLGKDGDYKMNNNDWFIGQHSIYRTGDGELMMFDNGGIETRQSSRALSFMLNENDMVATARVNVLLSQELSAYRMGSAEKISDGKYLICTTRKGGLVSVVNDTGAVIWQVELNNPSYRAYYIRDPFK